MNLSVLSAALAGGVLGLLFSRRLLVRGRKLDSKRLVQLAAWVEAGLAVMGLALVLLLLPQIYTPEWASTLYVATLVLSALAAVVLNRRAKLDWVTGGRIVPIVLALLLLGSEAVLANAAAGGWAAQFPAFNHHTFGKRSLPALAAGVSSRNEQVRIAALDELRNSFGDAADPLILRALQDPSAQVRGAALRCLANSGAPRWVDPLSRLAIDPDPDVAHLAWQQLGRLDDPRAVLPLVTALTRQKPNSATQMEVQNYFMNGLRKQLMVAVPPLLSPSSASEIDASIRAKAAELLKFSEDGSAEDVLVPALHDPSPEVRVGAATGLAELAVKIREEQARTLVEIALPKGVVAVSAGQENSQVDPALIASSLKGALGDPDPSVRVAAAKGLASVGGSTFVWAGKPLDVRNPDSRLRPFPLTPAVPVAEKLLHDPDARVRDGAAEVLGYAGDRSAIPALTAVDPKNAPERYCAVCTALHRLGVVSGLRHSYETYPY